MSKKQKLIFYLDFLRYVNDNKQIKKNMKIKSIQIIFLGSEIAVYDLKNLKYCKI